MGPEKGHHSGRSKAVLTGAATSGLYFSCLNSYQTVTLILFFSIMTVSDTLSKYAAPPSQCADIPNLFYLLYHSYPRQVNSMQVNVVCKFSESNRKPKHTARTSCRTLHTYKYTQKYAFYVHIILSFQTLTFNNVKCIMFNSISVSLRSAFDGLFLCTERSSTKKYYIKRSIW